MWNCILMTQQVLALFQPYGMQPQAAPDTALTFSFDVNGDTFAGSVFPIFPTVGGAATDVLTTSLSFVVNDGAVTRT
jgi:hypothetical protein